MIHDDTFYNIQSHQTYINNNYIPYYLIKQNNHHKYITYISIQIIQISQINTQDQLNYSYQTLYAIIDQYQDIPLAQPNNIGPTKSNNKKHYKAICGCGITYSCASSLTVHIKSKHYGKPPPGTIGLAHTFKNIYQPQTYINQQKVERQGNKRQRNNQKTPLIQFKDKQKKNLFKKKQYNINQHNLYQNNQQINGQNQQNTQEINKFNNQHMNHHQNYYLNNQPNQPYLQNELMPQSKQIITNNITSSQQNTRLEQSIHLTNQNQKPITRPIQRSNQFQSKTKKKGGKKQYISKRIYMCGQCKLLYAFQQELTLHLKKNHKGDIPDGTIYGVKKQTLLKYFGIPYQKIVPKQKTSYRCGCGKNFTCFPSLNYHIKTVHNNVQPVGTIGGTITFRL